jgi:hypothetical protein
VRFGDELPPGFLAVFNNGSPSTKSLTEAETFCTNQGGWLPDINKMRTLSISSLPSDLSIDGFGAPDDPWPSGLSDGSYWTGTQSGSSDQPRQPRTAGQWYVSKSNDKVYASYGSQGSSRHVACVP